METDFSLYYTIRLEDKKGKQFGDAAFESQKCSFSSNHVGVCVRALLNHNILKEAFDPLLEVPGLRPGMRFTTLHKLCCAKSDEEAAAYLQHTFDLWLDIALGSPENIKKINTKDVQAIELRCPRLCSRDAVDINGMFNNGSIFTAFDENDRQAIRQKILSIDYIIPSLHTFFQDVHLLELCATSMRSIVPPNNRMTIRATLRENYKPLRFGQSTRNRDSSTNEVSSNETDSFNSAMELLWIFVMGQFQRVPPKKRGKRLLADYPRKHSKEKREKLLSRFAKLAQSLGFEIRKIKGLSKLKIADYSENSIEHNIDSQLQSTLLQTRDSAVSIIKRDLKKTYDRSVARPELYARILRQRCGRPKHKRYRRDRNRLTKDLIHFDYGALDVKGQDITSFLVLRSQCLLFFSNPKEDLGHIVVSEPAATTSNLEQSRPSESKDLENIPEQDDRLSSYSSHNLARVEASEHAPGNATNTSEQSHPSYPEDLRDIREHNNISVSPKYLHNDVEDKPPLEERQTPSSNPLSAIRQPTRGFSDTMFEFVTYEDRKFESIKKIKMSDISDIVQFAQGEFNKGMVLYNLNLTSISIGELLNSVMQTVITIPSDGLTINQNVEVDVSNYKRRKENAARDSLRR